MQGAVAQSGTTCPGRWAQPGGQSWGQAQWRTRRGWLWGQERQLGPPGPGNCLRGATEGWRRGPACRAMHSRARVWGQRSPGPTAALGNESGSEGALQVAALQAPPPSPPPRCSLGAGLSPCKSSCPMDTERAKLCAGWCPGPGQGWEVEATRRPPLAWSRGHWLFPAALVGGALGAGSVRPEDREDGCGGRGSGLGQPQPHLT